MFKLKLTIPMSAANTELRQSFASAISSCKGDVEPLQTVFTEAPGLEIDKKSILEQAFRDVLHKKIVFLNSKKTKQLTDLVMLSSTAATLGISLFTVPFILLSDIFDCLTLDICEEVFVFVETHVSTWVSPEFYSSGKILLLRMCNDLLRRLSAAQNTVFCGRIQLFLAQLFPLSEKSALNLMSHFNVDNVTTFTNEEELRGGAEDSQSMNESVSMDVSLEEPTVPIDFNLYQKLWVIQDFFRQPTQCYVPEQWKILTGNMEEIFKAFNSYKLEEEARSLRRNKKPGSGPASVEYSDYSELHYFDKFLTSEKLMSLQLHDSHFRRHVLVQCLVLFQYLTSCVKFKGPSHVIAEVQIAWIKTAKDKVYALIAETPPNGEEFAAYVGQVLVREECWIAWKNEGCPSYEKDPQVLEMVYPEKTHLGNSCNSGRIDIGNKELNRLWNLCPDNLSACEQSNRVFMPEKAKFLEEPTQQADPEAKIDVEYKVVNNPNFTWQALRLLSTASSHFFQNTTAPIKPIPEYLEHVILQEAKDLQQLQQQAQASTPTPNGAPSQ